MSYDPRSQYETRLENRRSRVAAYDRLYRWIAWMRLGLAGGFVLALWLIFWRGALSGWWLVLPGMAFLALVLVHVRLADKRRRAREAVRFYEDGIARIEDRWVGRGKAGEFTCEPSHLYAADLDIFGSGSLFELLSMARTRSGEETLAAWLKAPAEREEILARQEGVDELRHHLDLREDLAILASDVRSLIHPDEMTDWGEGPAVLSSRWRLPALILGGAALVAALGVLFRGTDGAWLFLYGSLGVAALFALSFRSRVGQVLLAAGRTERDLDILSSILERLEREEFASAKLRSVQSSLGRGREDAPHQIRRFLRLTDMYEWRRLDIPIVIVSLVVFQPNVIILPFLFALWSTQMAFAIESWRMRVGSRIGIWISAVGEFEALCSLAGYAYEHPSDPFPEIAESGPLFDGEALGHPLKPSASWVPNTVHLGEAPQLLIVSGSNMSGKSTLLRTVGVNAVMALAGAPVRAERLRLSRLAIGSTIRIQDSLQAGTSRFYAEIQRIRQITERADGDPPVLFLLDEVLHGTNSHDRAQGADAIMEGLMHRGAIGLATTHDLALARIADRSRNQAVNVHFEDQLVGGKMIFDYSMKPGVVEHSNAIALMRAVGLEV